MVALETVAPLHDVVLVLEGVLPLKGVFHQGGAQGVKALRVVVVMDDLLHLAVFHPVVNPRIQEAHHLEILMEMYVTCGLKKSYSSTSIELWFIEVIFKYMHNKQCLCINLQYRLDSKCLDNFY